MASSVVIGDYKYTSYNANTANVEVVDKTKTSYSAILSSVTIDGVEYDVTRMTYCFADCANLTTAPEIPSGVTDMERCFDSCISLTTAPEIPSSVTDMMYCFYGCTALQGDIVVLNEPIYYAYIFRLTQNPITIRPVGLNNISIWQTIADGYNNVSVMLDSKINYTFLSSRRLTSAENTTYGTTRGVRINMLLDCGNSYALTGITPSSGRLYAIDGTRITFPYYSPNLLRCYLIYEPSSQVMYTSMQPLRIQIKNITSSRNELCIVHPNTATISQFEYMYNGVEAQCVPEINYLNSIEFIGGGKPYAMMDLVPYLYKSATSNDISNAINRNDNRTQINALKSDNILDIKHFVTTADNIQVTTDKTLQDIITECYEALET